jgi:DNA-directed RNA polymerase subunit RPC12/RpoP
METENVCEACGEGFDEGTLNVVGQLTCEPCLAVQREEYEDEAKRAVPAAVPTAVLVSKPLPSPEPPRDCSRCWRKFPWFDLTSRPFETSTGISVEGLVCRPCAEKLDEAAKPKPLTVKQVQEALEREDFHLDDLLDPLATEAGAVDSYEGARSCFARALLDRLTDGELAAELAFRLGEISDPFPV